MLAQIKDQQRTVKVLLVSIKDYNSENLVRDKLTFSKTMTNMTKRLNSANIMNQVYQITQDYNCSLYLPLWMKFIKSNGFFNIHGTLLGGFTLWLF